MDYKTVGTVGFSNLILLSCIIIWRWTKFYYETYISSESYTKNFRINLKKHANYALLLIASSCDLPMYVSFFEMQRYDLITFSFHKFQSAALFGAYSLIISDWNSVLYEIQEESFIPFMCRNGSLIAVNALLTVISIVNFAYCYSFPDIDTYANSKIYVLGVFIQIIAPLFLTISMLWAGLKLSWRIQGASGSLKFSKENAKIKEFKSAVFLINMVMLSVCVTIGGQVSATSFHLLLFYSSEHK